MSHPDVQVSSEAALAYRLAMVALDQARVARGRHVAEALMREADGYFRKAVAMGWRPPEILTKGRATE
jgi:hypothetical protein